MTIFEKLNEMAKKVATAHGLYVKHQIEMDNAEASIRYHKANMIIDTESEYLAWIQKLAKLVKTSNDELDKMTNALVMLQNIDMTKSKWTDGLRIRVAHPDGKNNIVVQLILLEDGRYWQVKDKDSSNSSYSETYGLILYAIGDNKEPLHTVERFYSLGDKLDTF